MVKAYTLHLPFDPRELQRVGQKIGFKMDVVAFSCQVSIRINYYNSVTITFKNLNNHQLVLSVSFLPLDDDKSPEIT